MTNNISTLKEIKEYYEDRDIPELELVEVEPEKKKKVDYNPYVGDKLDVIFEEIKKRKSNK